MKHILFKKTLVLAIVFLLSILTITPSIYSVANADDIENIKINVSENQNVIEINYKINSFIEKSIVIDGTTYHRISLDGESNILLNGVPDLPNICRSIIIPDTAEMKVTLTSSNYEEYNNVLIAPSKGNLLRTVNPEDIPFVFGEIYNNNNFYPGKIVELDEPYILRDYRGQVVKFYPIQYNPVTKTMRFYKDITVEVSPIGTDTRNIINRDELPLKVETNFNQIYKHHFINYGTLDRYTPLEEQGNMLIITYDAFWNNMLPFYEWKILKGIPTEMVNVSTIGDANAIKAYISSYYNTKGLTFVLLVGDAAQVPPYYLAGSASDPSNTYVVGSDHYPDLFIGRFSAENPSQVDTQVLRSVEYESAPQITAEWYHKGMGVASNQGAGIGDDGEADNVHMDNIRLLLLDYTYTHVDQIYDPTGTASMVTTGINDGRSLVNYCGHGSPTSWGSTGFSNTHVNALTNDNMLPFVLSVACNNGEFDSYTCFAEAWVRATNNGEPTGAIGAFMSTISQSWAPPMEAQDEFNLILVETYQNNKKTTLGGLTANGCMSMNDDYGSSGTGETDYWTLFGDPSLQIRTDTPAEMTVIHDELITIGTETFEVEVVGVENALCAISCDNELLGYGYTDENGIATINFFEPTEFMEGAQLVVTAYNKIPYIASIQIGDSYPPTVPIMDGPTGGRINKEYEFTAVSTDPEVDQIYYMFDWGDGTKSDWIGPVDSGTQVTAKHAWVEKGNYSVKAKAKDVEESTSRWTDPHILTIDVPEIKIKLVKGGFKLSAMIKNEGIAEADTVDWEINIEGGAVFLGRKSIGVIETVAPGESVMINSGLIMGFGKFQAQITFTGPECYDYRERGGSLFFFYVKMNPGG